jgi:hypothetical protein
MKEFLKDLFEKEKNKRKLLGPTQVKRKFNSVFNYLSSDYFRWNNSRLKYEKYQEKIIFGLKSGIVFYEDKVLFLNYKYWEEPISYLEFIENGGRKSDLYEGVSDYDFVDKFLTEYRRMIEEEIEKNERIELEKEKKKQKEKEKERARLKSIEAVKNKKELSILNTDFLLKYDVNNNGIIDVSESKIFNTMLNENESLIIQIDEKRGTNYLHNLVKVSSFLKVKSDSLQNEFKLIKGIKQAGDFKTHCISLENHIKNYNKILLFAIVMVKALQENKMILYLNIYEVFDKLEVFNSNWENTIKNGQIEANNNLNALMNTINKFENSLNAKLNELQDVIEIGLDNVSFSVDDVRSEVEFLAKEIKD